MTHRSIRNINIVLAYILIAAGELIAQPQAENLHTNKDVQDFFNAWYFKGQTGVVSEWKPYVQADGFVFIPDLAAMRYYRKGEYKPWIKKDLNGDGKQDILFSGLVNEQSLILAFFSDEKGYHWQQLNGASNDGWELIPFVRYLRKKKWVETGLIYPGSGVNQWKPDPDQGTIRIDTLQMINGRLLESSFGKQYHMPDSIKVGYSVSIRRTRYEWSFFKDSQVYISSIDYVPSDSLQPIHQNLYRLNVSPDTVLYVWKHCAQIPIMPEQRSYYGCLNPPLDGYHWETTLFYPGENKKQRFGQHMRSGPLFLEELYSLCERMRVNCAKEFVRRLR